MSFAAAEARANASSVGRLANATATIVLPAESAGTTVDGIFDADYLPVDAAITFASAAPAFTVIDDDLPPAVADALAGDLEGAVALEIRGTRFTVVEHKPDGTGITVLRLRK